MSEYMKVTIELEAELVDVLDIATVSWREALRRLLPEGTQVVGITVLR